jgi:hypothetical protein
MAASTIAGRPFQTALTLGQIFLPTRTIPRPSSTTAPIASNISTREGSAPTLRQRILRPPLTCSAGSRPR